MRSCKCQSVSLSLMPARGPRTGDEAGRWRHRIVGFKHAGRRTLLKVLVAGAGLSTLMTLGNNAGASVPAGGSRPRHTIFPARRWQSFHVHASNGYTIFVRSLGPNRVSIDAASREADVNYVAPARVTAESISASVPHLGRIAMHFHSVGSAKPSREPQGDCRGRRSVIQKGIFVGSFYWHAERGYTSARTSRSAGYEVHSFREVCKGEGAGAGNEGLVRPLLVAHSRTVHRVIEFQAYSLGPEESSFSLLVKETHPKLEVSRSLFGIGGAIESDPSGTIRITPDSPFRGAAKFQPIHDGVGSWTGALTAVLPGRDPVYLAGHSFAARRVSGSGG